MLIARAFSMSAVGGPPPPKPTSGSPNPAKDALAATPVLIVEDEAMIAWMIEDLLAEAGFTAIRMASTGEQAERLAAAGQPRLLITDINLGAGKDGIAAAAAIRGQARLPVIFVTAYADDATRKRIADTIPGAQLLRKPIDAPTLIRAVDRALGN